MQTETINYNQQGQQYNLKLFVNNIQIPNKNIMSCTIREWMIDNIVTLEVNFFDHGTFVELSPIYDECPISVEFSKNSDVNIVKMDFVMGPYETQREIADYGMIYTTHFIAFQKSVDYLYPIRSRAFKNMNSSDVIGEVVSESGFKYVNEISSNDNQTWYQSNCNNFDFIKHLMIRSYVKEEDLPVFYVNRNQEAVYSTIKTKCNKTAKFIAINNDYAYMDNGNDPFLASMLNDKVKTIYYKTDISYKNISPILNKINGYGIDYTYFDFKDFYDYRMIFNMTPLTKYMFQNKNNSYKFVNGLTYNGQHRNTHSNYLLGMTQNLYMRYSFYNAYTQINVRPDLDIQLGDKINMIIYDNLSRMVNDKPSVDKVNSGEYIVGGILHDIKKDGLYSMVLTLFRNGINESDIKSKTFELVEGDL